MTRQLPEGVEAFQASAPADLVDRYTIGVERLDRRVFDLDDDQLDRAWLPSAGVGRWPVRVLLGHLADAEVAFTHRLRRVVAEPGCEVRSWDQQAFIDAGHYGVVAMAEGAQPVAMPIGAAVGTVHTLRAWCGPWLRALPAQAWSRAGLHEERGPLTLVDLLAFDVWHLERHAFFCNAKIDALLGPEAGP
ncbi:MAG: DinB family protein [Planctomycetota bacterium]